MPGLFHSSSHGQLVSRAKRGMGGAGKYSRDTYPQDIAGYGYAYPGGSNHGFKRLHSATASVDGHSALQHSDDSDSSSSSSDRMDTVYGDEDRYHNPLNPLQSALGDVNEDPRESDEEEDPDNQRNEDQNKTPNKEEEEKPATMKRSGTWSKLQDVFKNKRLSDDEDEDAARAKHERSQKRQRKKNKKAKKQKLKQSASNGQHHGDESSSESHPAPKRKGKLSRSHNELQPMHGSKGGDDERSPLKH